MQKIVYSFDCTWYEHTMTLNYEPLTNDEGRSSKIPAYEQKCIWTCSEMPNTISSEKSVTITIEGKYTGKNEYGGISCPAWIYTDDERITITNSDGITKDKCTVGSYKEIQNDSLKTSFTFTVPDEVSNFTIYFETTCGTTVFRYSWQGY